MSKRRVVVTGLGLVCPVGGNVADAWAAILRSESGIGPITRFDVSSYPTRIGGAVKGFAIEQYMSAKEARRMDEFMHYGIAAGVQAAGDASGLDHPSGWIAMIAAGSAAGGRHRRAVDHRRPATLSTT